MKLLYVAQAEAGLMIKSLCKKKLD